MSDELKWVPGAMEGAFGHHAGGGDNSQDRADHVADRLRAAARRPSKRNLAALYNAVCADDVLSIVDRVVTRVAGPGKDRSRVHEIGRWLATTGVDRGAVKTGVALLGATGLGKDVEVVRVLGRHEEFTLYVAVAMSNGAEQPEVELWDLARKVQGWGRIHCVERLSTTLDPGIQDWILRGRLPKFPSCTSTWPTSRHRPVDQRHAAGEAVDRPLLTAAGEILEALVNGGPARDMDDYTDGADAVEAFLALLQVRRESLGDFSAVASINRFLGQAEGWDDRSGRGWSATRREAFENQCAAILNAPEWDEHIRVGFMSDDQAEFWRADVAARERGIDTFDIQVAKISRIPWVALGSERGSRPISPEQTRSPRWLGNFSRWRRFRPALPTLLVSVRTGVHTLPLTGRYRLFGITSASVQICNLDKLRENPVSANPNMSLNALKAWPKESWPAGARELTEHVAVSDPKEKTRALAVDVIGS